MTDTMEHWRGGKMALPLEFKPKNMAKQEEGMVLKSLKGAIGWGDKIIKASRIK